MAGPPGRGGGRHKIKTIYFGYHLDFYCPKTCTKSINFNIKMLNFLARLLCLKLFKRKFFIPPTPGKNPSHIILDYGRCYRKTYILKILEKAGEGVGLGVSPLPHQRVFAFWGFKLSDLVYTFVIARGEGVGGGYPLPHQGVFEF